MKGRPNSAQSEWLRHPNVTWRSAFPLFSSLWDSAGMLLAHEGRLLVLAAGLLVAVTFGLVLVLAMNEPIWLTASRVIAAELWTLLAVALVGVWTSLGRGDWHFRFLLGLLAAAWIAVVHVAAEASASYFHSSADLCTRALATFALSAFGGAWLRSLGRWELAGPHPDATPSRLRLFQFSTATLFRFMLLTAIVLGLWQMVSNLEGRVYLRTTFLRSAEARAAILVASAAALAAYAIVFGGWKTGLAMTVALAVLLVGVDYFAGSLRGASILELVSLSLSDGALAAGAVSLSLALAPLVVLRLSGFHREGT